MESLILVAALLGRPAECPLPTIADPPPAVQIHAKCFHRRPAQRALRAVGRCVHVLRPFHRRCCRR
ncbi:MAG TPA: hypothetical protein VMY42_03070 [Thermoguttaceae bacterium]|nr:hypothetical protein [Thermoguttaceae bacterium]